MSPYLIVILLLIAVIDSNSERIRLDAKKLLNGKVIANGLSIPAKSLSSCIDNCNHRKKTCDGVVYHEIIKKCRLINKCAVAHHVDNSSDVVYYSKRPRLLVPGYLYEAKSDSCIGIIKTEKNYADADDLCKEQNAQLIMIDKLKLNELAAKLLSRFGIEWAWINFENVASKSSIKPHGYSGNDVLPQKTFSPEIVQYRNNSLRNCWGLNNRGQWGQFSCKNKTMASLCQIQQFIF